MQGGGREGGEGGGGREGGGEGRRGKCQVQLDSHT